jgi:hypothetical protein
MSGALCVGIIPCSLHWSDIILNFFLFPNKLVDRFQDISFAFCYPGRSVLSCIPIESLLQTQYFVDFLSFLVPQLPESQGSR